MRWIGLWLAVACTPRPVALQPVPPGLTERTLDPRLEGISGITRGSTTSYWLLPERGGLIWRYEPATQVYESYLLAGQPPDLDLEDIAVMPNGELVFATENTRHSRTTDQILFARFDGCKVRIGEASRTFHYQPWGIEAEPNRGLEGLCVAGSTLAAVAEATGDGARRFAPLTVWAHPKVSHHRLPLTSAEGKISALACRAEDGELTFFAIERHYQVVRLLKFTLAALEPQVVLDLGALYPGLAPNFEGLAFAPDGGLFLVSDNHHGRRQGTTRLLHVAPCQLNRPGKGSPLSCP